MPADVYANDNGLRDGVRGSPPAGAAAFTLIADADADLLGRVGAVLTLLNVAPRAFHMEVGAEGTATVNAVVTCTESQADLVARKLERLTSVRDVGFEYTPADT